MANRGNETAEERRKLPKNIRQIGETGRGDRVYLEDYAVTFLRQTKAAVLLGEICSIEGHTYYFVNGALEAQRDFQRMDGRKSTGKPKNILKAGK